MADGNEPRQGRQSAAELLGDWRGAEREVVHAQTHADTVAIAANAAKQAQIAAEETSEAARLSKAAAEHAAEAADRTAEAAALTAVAAADDAAVDKSVLEQALQAASDAGDRFREAQRRGFASTERESGPAEA
ncbi:MAG TPA: hypothetical protein VE011_00740 [Candidatus Dormibacteraeota bacterium]|nr:hypothetical protein [Candidatus Dormibacteraeota bacterium]